MPFDKSLLPSDDASIINSLSQQGIDRKKAEDLLFTRYTYFIQQAVRRYSVTEDEAFTIYSDTIVSAIPKLTNGSFEGRSTLKTWLFQIFHNKCVDLVRKKTTNKNSVHRTVSVPEMLLSVTDSAKTILQQLMEKTDHERLKQKLNQLGENCRNLLWQWAEGYSDKEIVESLHYKTADVVKTSRLRCLERLRQLYKTIEM